MSRLIRIFTVCLVNLLFIPIIKIWNKKGRCPNLADCPNLPDFTLFYFFCRPDWWLEELLYSEGKWRYGRLNSFKTERDRLKTTKFFMNTDIIKNVIKGSSLASDPERVISVWRIPKGLYLSGGSRRGYICLADPEGVMSVWRIQKELYLSGGSRKGYICLVDPAGVISVWRIQKGLYLSGGSRRGNICLADPKGVISVWWIQKGLYLSGGSRRGYICLVEPEWVISVWWIPNG